MTSFNTLIIITSSLFNNFIIQIIFQLYTFIEIIDQLYLHKIFHKINLIIEYIHDNYSRFEIISIIIRIFKYSISAKSPNFLFTWVIDIAIFKRLI